jgi:hypothetical protein
MNNICLQPNMFEMFISTILFKKNILKYLSLKKIGVSNSNILVSSYLNSIRICKKYNIFHEVKNFYEEFYINNPIIKNSYEFNNIYLEDLESSNSIDI